MLGGSKVRSASPNTDDGYPGVFTNANGRYSITGVKPGTVLLVPYP